MSETRVASLDGVRGVAILAVVLYHLELADSGYLGVDVFFVLSGFFITSLLVREHRRTGSVHLGRFYWRRVLRLYPALLAVVAFCLLVAVAVATKVGETVGDAAAALAYVSNITGSESGLLDHTWTLALEEQFYLVWPAVFLLAVSRRWRRLGWASAVAIVGGILVLDLLTGREGVAHSYVRAMGLPLGCALAMIRDRRAFGWIGRFGPAAAVALLAAFVLPLPGWSTTGWPISVGALLAVPVVAWAAEAPVPGLDSPLMVWFGLRSYSLYLWHFPLLSLAGNHAPSRVSHSLALALGLIGSLVAAEASYRLVELPVLRWRDRAPAGRGKGRTHATP